MKKLFLLLLILGYGPLLSYAKPVLELDSQVKKSYLNLLEQATDLHKVIVEKDDQALKTEIQETQAIIARLYSQISSMSQFHHRIYSHKILKAIEDKLAVLDLNDISHQNGKNTNLKKLFNSFYELARVYDLKKDIKAKGFYCSRDKSVWFQKAGKANNPINPNHKTCGRVIL